MVLKCMNSSYVSIYNIVSFKLQFGVVVFVYDLSNKSNLKKKHYLSHRDFVKCVITYSFSIKNLDLDFDPVSINVRLNDKYR